MSPINHSKDVSRAKQASTLRTPIGGVSDNASAKHKVSTLVGLAFVVRVENIFILFTFVVLLTSAETVASVSAKETFPPYSETQAYVSHLLSAYNALVQYNWENRPDFNNVQNFFLLYAPAGETFNAIVMLAGPNDNNSVDIMFVPASGSHSTVVYDLKDYLNMISTPSGINQTGFYITTRLNLTGDYDSADNFLFDYNGTLTHATVAIGVRTSDITGNYSVTSVNEAQWLYTSEANYAQNWLAANTPTTTSGNTSIRANESTLVFAGIAALTAIAAAALATYPMLRAEGTRRYNAWTRDCKKKSTKYPLVGIDPRAYKGIFWSDRRIYLVGLGFAIVAGVSGFLAVVG